MDVQTALGCEFAVAEQLFFQGYYASITLKNYPGYDIFANNTKSGKSVGINVKAVGTGKVWPKSADDGIMKVYVDAQDKKHLRFYVVPSNEEVKVFQKFKSELLAEGKKVTTFGWCDFSYFSQYEDRWDLLGI